MTYSRSVLNLLKSKKLNLDVIEVEPQTLWFSEHPINGPFKPVQPVFEEIFSADQRILLHSVGVPLGGTRTPNKNQMELLKELANLVDSPWVSEHLSVAGTPHDCSGFLLPPIQTEEGIEIAVRNIKTFYEAIGRPVAIETGVAYLKRKPFEMADGEFLREVSLQSGCGILLDIHNIYCNHRNGRISIDEFLSEIPSERVWEVHLAGGMEFGGFYVDAHSGRMSSDLKEISRDIISGLPNIGALNFEVYDSFLENTELETLEQIVDDLHELWEEIPSSSSEPSSDAPKVSVERTPQKNGITAEDWETSLCEYIKTGSLDNNSWLEDEKALILYRKLATSFRGSLLVRALPRTMRYIFLIERDNIESLMDTYYQGQSAQLYAPLEAKSFARFVREIRDDEILNSLLDYDLALIKIAQDEKAIVVNFPCNPQIIFESIASGELPKIENTTKWEIEILPDAEFAESVGINHGS